ncbi:hypothetical protein GOHSU_18_01420 [Gordonia hirsuta DSM 44140 = NBRC 16056]|uniref:Bacterial bifunctional deaminase-reductase C-terminal domain-containing protein n=1 Tax=Gordonia hirsuta DSM 44140 = NBRC 16056 TaxID=1121927 RepID=L7LBE8_9ACTN|nr:dihydrofolate reductase family protein [Gordonia hirsuta]GAC57387.1 hypothetical protein GOHSU_18_01420 [Gordonia hirsuta DSM 44140 = NBRC 16056]
MFLLHKATQVTTSPTSGADPAPWLREQYAFAGSRPDGRPRLRANMVSAIDGGATADGKSGALGSPGDRLLFGLLRELSDAVLVGASTAVTENYRVPEPRPDGTRPALILSSRSLSIPDDYATAFDPGTLIATCTQAPPEQRRRLTQAGATLVDCGTDTVEPTLLLEALAERGFERITCEGGPRFLAELIAAGALDQLAVTLSPHLVGGNAPRIAHGASPAGGMAGASLQHLIGDDDGFLYFLWNTAPTSVADGTDEAGSSASD